MNTKHMEELFPLEIGKATFESQEELGYTYTSDFVVMVEAKPQRNGKRTTLFTKEHFQEMIKLHEFFLNLTAPKELTDRIKPDKVTFEDLCRKRNITDEIVERLAEENCATDNRFCLPSIPEKCTVTQSPLDFIYDRKSDTYDLDQFETDMDLIARIQTGKGDAQFMFYGHKNLYVELMFASTTPSKIK